MRGCRSLKGPLLSCSQRGKKQKEMRWVTTCLISDSTEATTPQYSDWEACASLYVAVDILTHHDSVRNSGLEGQSSTTARGLLVIIDCRLQRLLQNPPPEADLDMENMATLVDIFSFNEIKKRSLQSRVCYVLCETTSD